MLFRSPKITLKFIPYAEAYGADFEDVRRRVPDLARLEETLGTKPLLPLGEILDDIIRHKKGHSSPLNKGTGCE